MVMLLTVSRELSYILVQNTKAILKTISQLAQPILLQFPCWGPSGGFFEDETYLEHALYAWCAPADTWNSIQRVTSSLSEIQIQTA